MAHRLMSLGTIFFFIYHFSEVSFFSFFPFFSFFFPSHSFSFPLLLLSYNFLLTFPLPRSRGHESLAKVLDPKESSVGDNWKPKPGRWAASSRFREARKTKSTIDFEAAYAGGVVNVSAGQIIYEDNLGRLLVGWHGTYSPPCGMDGESLVGDD
jgi:hypothetical protein